MPPLLPFALVLGLLAVAALAAGLGFTRIGKALAVSTLLTPTTGVLGSVAGLLLVLRVLVPSPAPGLTVAALLSNGLLAFSLATLAIAPAFAARRVRRERGAALRAGRPSPAWIALSGLFALAAAQLAMT